MQQDQFDVVEACFIPSRNIISEQMNLTNFKYSIYYMQKMRIISSFEWLKAETWIKLCSSTTPKIIIFFPIVVFFIYDIYSTDILQSWKQKTNLPDLVDKPSKFLLYFRDRSKFNHITVSTWWSSFLCKYF